MFPRSMVRERQALAEGAGTESAAHAQLTLPGRGADTAAPGGVDAGNARGNGAAFECRTCGKRFSSFQALGGHRTGHARLRARHGTPAHKAAAAAARAHGCGVCGLEFPMGQALGGHMRRHRGDARSEEEVFDLNSPPQPLEDRGGGDREERSPLSKPRLLNLLV